MPFKEMIDYIAKLLPVTTVSAFLLSVCYDWGYITTLGLTFSFAPTSISDHVRSALDWLGEMIILLLAFGYLRLRFMSVPSSSIDPGIRFRPRLIEGRFMEFWYGGSGFWNGHRFCDGVLAVFAFVMAFIYPKGQIPWLALFVLFLWGFLYAMLRRFWKLKHISMPTSLAVYLVPAVLIAFFIYGSLAATWALQANLNIVNIIVKQPGSTFRNVRVLRYYEKTVLVKTSAGSLVFINLNDIASIEHPFAQQPDVINQIACGLGSAHCKKIAL